MKLSIFRVRHGLLTNFLLLISVISLLAYKSYQTQTSHNIVICLIICLCSYYATAKMIPVVAQTLLHRNIWGYDINKSGQKNSIRIPESLGITCGIVFIISEIFQAFLMRNVRGTTKINFSSKLKISELNAALFSICLMLLLGFLDDVLNLRWLVKILLSAISTLPLLAEYSGTTQVLAPKPLRPFLGTTLDLGLFYHVYLGLIIIFCTNGINIYAGINGLETSQTVIISLSTLLFNFIEMDGPCGHMHRLSIYLTLPFLATTLVLAYYNAYPSLVFVGDSFTYFSGMLLAVASIKGHFSKTLILFFIPQLINFFISIPQLLGMIPCPKHRLPIYNEKTRLLSYSKNFTLINLALYVVGPMSEKNLCMLLNAFHVLCCMAAFFIRYLSYITDIFYEKTEILGC